MKKYILPLLVAGLQFAACTTEDESIFEQSAAERLEAGQKEYFQTLCEQGGTWVMEYFSNYDEQGYVFVMKFESDKSVTIHADHKWIDGYKSEKSLWDVINDDGNVLTFNSYNTLFHIFSTPENIEGPNAPTDDDGKDVDELGYGHNGDYEFMLMENDGNTIRLRGKKRGIYAYLRRLPSDTDAKAYLEQTAALRKQFDAKHFPNYIMTETSTGVQYDVTGLSEGVVSVVPMNSTNPFAHTVKQPCVITTAGMRPLTAFDFIREDNSHFTVNEFTWDADGALVAPGVRLTAPSPVTNLARKDLKWNVLEETMSDNLIAAVNAANEQTSQIKGFGRTPKVKNLRFEYNANNSGRISFALSFSVGDQPCDYFGTFEPLTDGRKFKMTFNIADKAVNYMISRAPALQPLLDYFSGEYEAQNISPLDPSIMQLTNLTHSGISFNAQVK